MSTSFQRDATPSRKQNGDRFRPSSQHDIPVTPIAKRAPPKSSSHNTSTIEQSPMKKQTPSKYSTTPNPKPGRQNDSFADTSTFNPKSTIPYQDHFGKDTDLVINAMKSTPNKQKLNVPQSQPYNHRSYTEKNPDRNSYYSTEYGNDYEEPDEEEEEEEENYDHQEYENTEDDDDDDDDHHHHHYESYQQQHQPQSQPSLFHKETHSEYIERLKKENFKLQKSLELERNKNHQPATTSSTPVDSSKAVNGKRPSYQSPPSMGVRSPQNTNEQYINGANNDHEEYLTIQQYRKKIDSLNDQIYREKDLTLEKEDQIIDLQRELDQLNLTITKLNKDNFTLKKAITSSNKRFQKDAQSFSENENDLIMEKKNLEITIQNLNKEIMILRATIDSQNNENQVYQVEEKKKIDKIIKKSQKDTDKYNSEIENLMSQLSQKDSNISNLKSQIMNLTNELKAQNSLFESHQALKAELENVTEEYEKIKNENDEFKKSASDFKSNMRAMDEMKREIHQLKFSNSSFLGEREIWKKREEELSSSISRSERVLESLKEKRKQLEIENQTLRSQQPHEVQKLKRDLETYKKENRALNDENRNEKSKAQETYRQYTEQIERLTDQYRREIDSKQVEYDNIKAQLQYALQDLHLAQINLNEGTQSAVISRSRINTLLGSTNGGTSSRDKPLSSQSQPSSSSGPGSKPPLTSSSISTSTPTNQPSTRRHQPINR